MSKKATIVAIEGPDKVGKATQTRLLVDSLVNKGFHVNFFEVPRRRTLTGSIIYSMLRNGDVARHPNVFQFIQFLNKLSFQLFVLPKLRRTCDFIVLDRWVMSSIVYGTVSGCPRWYVDSLAKLLVEPDCTIVLHGRAFARDDATLLEKGADDAYESNDRFMATVAKKYVSVAREKKLSGRNYVLVSNEGSPTFINDKIISKVRT